MARINQNLSDVSDEDMGGGGWTAWPQGDYRMMVIGSEYKATKAGDGHYLNLKLVCLDGEQNGKEKYDILVLEHPNPDTTKIARAKLKELAIAVGHPTPDQVDESEDLHGVPMQVYITRKKAKDPQYGDGQGFENRIAGYSAAEERKASPPQASRQTARPLTDEPPF